MTPDKVREVIAIYRKRLKSAHIEPKDYPHGKLYEDEIQDFRDPPMIDRALEHCAGMLDKMEGFIDEGRMDKVYRWLGFLQGVLWAKGIYTLNALMNHNKKD